MSRASRRLLTVLRRRGAPQWLLELLQPADATEFTHPADGHIQIIHSHENGKTVNIYYRHDGTEPLNTYSANRIYLYGSTSPIIRHYQYDDEGNGTLDVTLNLNTLLGLSEGATYTTDLYFSDDTITIYVNDTLLSTLTVAANKTYTDGVINHTLASNDLEVRVGLPFDPAAVAGTRLACLYDSGISNVENSEGFSSWSSGKNSLTSSDGAQVIAPSPTGLAGFVTSAGSGALSQAINVSQPFSIYALASYQYAIWNDDDPAFIARFDSPLNEDVGIIIRGPDDDNECQAISGNSPTNPDSEIGAGEAFADRTWQRLRAVFNGASSLLQVEGTTVEGALDNHGINGQVKALEFDGINLAHLQVIEGAVSDLDHMRLWGYLGTIKDQLPVYSSKILFTPATGQYRSFGNAEVYDTDKLVACYHYGPDHYGLNGDVRFITSADAGATWSAETVINTVAEGDYQRGARIGVLTSGRWLVVYITQNSTQTAAPSYCRYSDDEGATWSDAIEFTPPEHFTAYGVSVVSPPISLANGDVITSGWGYQTSDNKTSVVVYRSEDEGATWSVDSTVAVAGKQINETCMQILANGDLMMLIRGQACPIYRTTADPTADPLVWSTPTELFRGEAFPGFRQLSNGRIILCTRDYASTYYELTGNYPMCLYLSDDNGLTWDGPHYPEPTHRKFMYGRPVELGGHVYLFWSQTSLGSTYFWRNIDEYAS